MSLPSWSSYSGLGMGGVIGTGADRTHILAGTDDAASWGDDT